MRFLIQHLQRTGAKPQAIMELGELVQQVASLSIQVSTMAGSLVGFELLLKDAGVMTDERMETVKLAMHKLFQKQPGSGVVAPNGEEVPAQAPAQADAEEKPE